MDPVPYRIREDDVDEVLSAYSNVLTDEQRADARRYVLRNVLEIDEIVRTAPESDDVRADARALGRDQPASASHARRELALAAIEDLLIRDGYIEEDPTEDRVFPSRQGR